MRCVRLLLVCLVIARASAATTPPPVLTGERLIAEAQIVISIDDMLWCERALTTFANTAGHDPAVFRALLAGALFRSRSLAGIDLSRPALVLWGSRPGEFQAQIPLSDRRAFIEDFGSDNRYGTPLVRVGERDGTLVYTQNTPQGLIELRVLVQNDLALIAPTIEACRALGQCPQERRGTQALRVRFSGKALAGHDWLARLPVDPRRYLAGPNLLRWIDRFGGALLRSQADQVDRLELGVRGADDRLFIEGRLLARSDSPLAQLLAAQKNQSSRLLPLIRTPNTAIACYGSFSWQGQLDRFGQELTANAPTIFAATWNPAIEDAWRKSWAARDRNGTFAAIVDCQPAPGGGVATTSVVLTEQPNAADLVVHARTIEEALARSSPLADARSFEDSTVAGLSGWRCAITKGRDAGRDGVVLATGRHVVTLESSTGRSRDLALDVVPRVLLDGGQKPEGTSALCAISIDALVIAQAMCGASLSQVNSATATLVLKASPQGDLTLHGEVPLVAIAQVVRDMELVTGEPAEPAER